MEELKLLTAGYALFVALMAVEATVAWRRGQPYRLGEAVANIGHGVVFQVGDAFTKGLVMLPFLWVSGYAVAALPHTVWGWLVGLLAYDFCSYWRHRHKHEIHVLWAIHGVHHAAEDFNFAAALRQALFQNVLGWLWMLPIALFVPVDMFVGLVVFDYLYQFLQHTRFVPTLGPLEWVLNTPSHHRVHHGTEPKYLDKNYGGILIIWDRLLGTFQVEEEEPTYGLTRPIGSLNPLWGNVALFADLIAATRRTSSWRDAVALWVRGPGAEAELAPGGVVRPRGDLANADIPPSRVRIVLGSMGLAVPLLAGMVWSEGPVAWLLALLAIAAVVTPATVLASRREPSAAATERRSTAS